jgi:hypothetical protein
MEKTTPPNVIMEFGMSLFKNWCQNSHGKKIRRHILLEPQTENVTPTFARKKCTPLLFYLPSSTSEEHLSKTCRDPDPAPLVR